MLGKIGDGSIIKEFLNVGMAQLFENKEQLLTEIKKIGHQVGGFTARITATSKVKKLMLRFGKLSIGSQELPPGNYRIVVIITQDDEK